MGKADEQIRVVRVVVVSPGDVAKERAVAQTVVDELNRGVAADRGCRLSLWRWESEARAGMHVEGPQGLIDELMDIQDADVVVGVFWRRFGTPTGEEDSGTEHELRRAWAAWQEHGRPEVMVYFCTRPYSPRAPDELAQWRCVLEFRDAMPEQQLWWPYESVGQFETLLREHLTRFVRTRMAAPESGLSRLAGRVRFNVPAVAASFTGREEELDALDDALGVADRAVITQTITGLTRGASIEGTAMFDGVDLLQASEQELRAIRGLKIGMIFQDPLTSLHPAYSVGWQIIEMIKAHDRKMPKAKAKEQGMRTLWDDGLAKVVSGVTALEELGRVLV